MHELCYINVQYSAGGTSISALCVKQTTTTNSNKQQQTTDASCILQLCTNKPSIGYNANCSCIRSKVSVCTMLLPLFIIVPFLPDTGLHNI